MGAAAGRAVLNVFGALVVALMLAIALQVLANLLDWTPLARFPAPVPLFGEAVTLNSLLDLQWHLLAAIALLPAGLVWLRDGHVRVDFLYNRRGPRGRAWTDILGNLLFAAPFLWMSVPAARDFARRAWASGEGSASGGLQDLWLVKTVLPLGLALLGLAILWETARLLWERRGR